MSTSDEFRRIAVEWVAEEITREFIRRLRKLALQLFRMIVIASPVDTGRFRASWDLTVGGFSDFEGIGPEGTGGNENRATSIAIARGLQALTPMQKLDTPPRFIGISNNLPYGPRLEYEGLSKKSGPGFVRGSVAAVRAEAKSKGLIL